MFYKESLKEAYRITIKNKLYWLFGLFVVLLGAGGIFEGFTNTWINFVETEQRNNFLKMLDDTGISNLNFFKNFIALSQTDFSSFLLVLFLYIFILVAILLIAFLVVNSQIALIYGANKKGETRKSDLKNIFLKSWKEKIFWHILLIDALYQLLNFVLIYTLSGLTFQNSSFLAFKGVNYIIFIISLFGLSILYFTSLFGIIFRCTEKKSLIESLKTAFQFLLKNLITVFEYAFLIFGIQIIFGLTIILAVTLFIIPSILIMGIFLILNMAKAYIVFNYLITGIIILFISLAGAMISAFQYIAWVLFLKGTNNSSSVKNFFQKFLNK